MSWLLDDGGFELFMNRDEKRSRAPAEPPSPAEENGVAYLAPRDADAGGTWVAVNELGLALCLVNRYPDPQGAGFTSRGLLVRELAGAHAAAEVEERLRSLESGAGERYKPFTLLAFGPGEPPFAASWDGERLLLPSPALTPPISSSSYDPAGIDAVRRRLWETQSAGRALTAEDLLDFHRSHRPERGPLSPCMHRADARTVSLTRVRVTPAAVEMAYAAGPPCRVALSRPLTLTRGSARSRRQLAPVV